MDIFTIVATAIVLLGALTAGLRRGTDDPNWELRWRALDPEYRDWLAAIATSPKWMKALSDLEEIKLTKGFARRELRRFAIYDLAAAALLVLVLALTLAGVLPVSVCTLGIGLYAMVRLGLEWGRKQQIRRRLAQRSDSEAAPPRPSTAPA